MKVSRIVSSVAVAAMLLSVSGVVSEMNAKPFEAAQAPKGTNLGYIKGDPYGNSPLSALVDLNGKRVKDVHVTVKGKPNGGIDISYPVGPIAVNTHDGIPVWGLYADYKNTIVVDYTDIKTGKKYKDTYQLLTPPIGLAAAAMDNRNITSKNKIEIKKVDKRFKDSLFMTYGNNILSEGSTLGWTIGTKSGPTEGTSATGSLGFTAWPYLHMVDSQGEYRWWLDPSFLAESDTLDAAKMGQIMGVRETKSGTFTLSYGQFWGEFDLTGKVLYKHRLPRGYLDISHEVVEMPNGNVLVRAAKANYINNEGDKVHTVRDHILEFEKSGRLVRVWDLNKSLDPYRDALLVGLDQGAVCLNIDASQAGKTVDSFETDAAYGDITGIGTGRNWAHVNSIAYDPKDDGIILSLRHQGVVKLTGDNQVKWILAPRAGWRPDLAKKLLTPVDSKGKKLDCDINGVCENSDFDFTWSQHTAWLSPTGTVTVLDNGDGRWNTQPALPTDKYTRFVEYKVDEKNMTVQQLWEYGKERGYDWYSPITSNVELITNDGKPYMYGFNGSVNLFADGKQVKGIHNIIDYKTKDVLFEADVYSNRMKGVHYRGLLIEPERAFAQ